MMKRLPFAFAIWAVALSRAWALEPQVELEWTTSTEPDLAYYSVYRADGQTTGSMLEFERVSTTTAPTFRDGGLEEKTTYTYAVTATDEAGNESVPSAYAWIRVPDQTAPLQLRGLTVRALEADRANRSVRLRFDVNIGFYEEAERWRH